jgi:nucleoid DNA-binding protein
MITRGMIDRLEEAGLTREDAAAEAERVFAAMRAELAAGRTVPIDGIGRLVAPLKPVWVPGSRKTQARQDRKIALKHGAVVERGEPYAV